jgi:hypothetical protein
MPAPPGFLTNTGLLAAAVMFQVEVFWIVTPCGVVIGYQRFRGTCCLHLQGGVTLKRWCPMTLDPGYIWDWRMAHHPRAS